MKIKTYQSEEFRQKFVENTPDINNLFKANYETFFCLKIEDFKNYTKFPIPPSKEICHTIVFITQGSYKHTIGLSEFETQNDEIFCTPAGQIFSIGAISKDVAGFTCHFHPNILIGKFCQIDTLNNFDFLKVWGDAHIKLNHLDSVFICNLFTRLQSEYSTNGIKNLAIIQTYLLALLAEINNNYEAHSKDNHTSAASITNKFKENLFVYKGKKGVSDYARQLNITPNHLNKSVKAITGKSPAKWIAETVVLEAKYLLHQADMTINDVATEVGHDDHSYFSRIFKKMEGISPIAYRKLIEKS